VLSLVLVAAAITSTGCGSSVDSTGTSTGAGSSPSTNTSGAPSTTVPGTSSTVAATTTTTVDPGTLPQTEEQPSAAGDQWAAGTQALWDAIVTDDPSKAMSFFFPLSAYKQVKGISNPEHDYETRLIAYYEEDIHALHKKLGSDAAKAQFVKIDVPAAAQWIKPGVEYNKDAYFRVLDSKLLYSIDGKQLSFVVKSMISWRGQWYVVHLTSIR